FTSLLLRSAGRKLSFCPFFFGRTLQFFPLYFESLFIYYGLAPAILILLAPLGNQLHSFFRPAAQVFAWLYLVNWRMGLLSFAAIPQPINHFWSLSIEEQFYLGWPFVVRTLNRRWLVILCLALAAVSLSLRIVFHHLHMRSAAYVLTFCRLDSLAFGAIIACAAGSARHWSVAKKAAPWLTASASIGLIVLIGV